MRSFALKHTLRPMRFASVFMGEKLRELDGDFWPEGEWSIRVVDDTGATVCAIRVTGH